MRDLPGTVERVLARFDQDRRNARMIGELSVFEFRRRLLDRRPAPSTPVSAATADVVREHGHDAPVHPLSLLGVSELLAAIDEMNPDELASFRQHEESGRRRPLVLEALERRSADVTT